MEVQIGSGTRSTQTTPIASPSERRKTTMVPIVSTIVRNTARTIEPQISRAKTFEQWQQASDGEWAARVGLQSLYEVDWRPVRKELVRDFVDGFIRDDRATVTPAQKLQIRSVTRGVEVTITVKMIWQTFGLRGTDHRVPTRMRKAC